MRVTRVGGDACGVIIIIGVCVPIIYYMQIGRKSYTVYIVYTL